MDGCLPFAHFVVYIWSHHTTAYHAIPHATLKPRPLSLARRDAMQRPRPTSGQAKWALLSGSQGKVRPHHDVSFPWLSLRLLIRLRHTWMPCPFLHCHHPGSLTRPRYNYKRIWANRNLLFWSLAMNYASFNFAHLLTPRATLKLIILAFISFPYLGSFVGAMLFRLLILAAF